ncbi:hypothetical protein [Luteimonas qiangzhengi]|uniref:hypothetical protein n=1 Tax=Luteimonas sp. MJ146 TaxID=3129240 RepID=UPI0031BB4485
MNALSPLTGEVSDSKVAAIFDSESNARSCARQLRDALRLRQSQVQVITRHDRHPGRKMEPEGRGIFRTIITAHAKLGVAGLVLGVLVFALLYASGLELVTASPRFAAALIIGYGGVFGLMAGGLVSLRPDHDPYIEKVREALAEGRSAVVVHAFNANQRDAAQDGLDKAGGDTIRTL